MAKLLKIVLILLCVWTAVEVYTEGVNGAFGGLFAGFDGSALEAPANRSTPDRAADAFQRAYNKSETRVDAMLEEKNPSD
jgi:hypothetical protein